MLDSLETTIFFSREKKKKSLSETTSSSLEREKQCYFYRVRVNVALGGPSRIIHDDENQQKIDVIQRVDPLQFKVQDETKPAPSNLCNSPLTISLQLNLQGLCLQYQFALHPHPVI